MRADVSHENREIAVVGSLVQGRAAEVDHSVDADCVARVLDVGCGQEVGLGLVVRDVRAQQRVVRESGWVVCGGFRDDWRVLEVRVDH